MSQRTVYDLSHDSSCQFHRTLEARLGYGVTMFEGLYTGTPELGLGLSKTGREYSVGWRLAESTNLGLVFGFDVKGSRHESVDSDAKPEHRVGLRVMARW